MGTTDWALGSIPRRARDVAASSRRIIQRYWNALAPRRCAETLREMWESVESEGLISGEEALRMRVRMFRVR